MRKSKGTVTGTQAENHAGRVSSLAFPIQLSTTLPGTKSPHTCSRSPVRNGCPGQSRLPRPVTAAQPGHGLLVIRNHSVQHTAFSLLMTALLSTVELLPHNLSEILSGILISPLLVTSLWPGLPLLKRGPSGRGHGRWQLLWGLTLTSCHHSTRKAS